MSSNEEVTQFITPEENESSDINVAEARNEAPLLSDTSERQKARLLIFTRDISMLEEGSATQRRIIDESKHFLEIHVVVLTLKPNDEKASIMRLAANVWMYPTNSSSWWLLTYDAYKIAQHQLVFSGGFRADVVVSEDVFESGLAGWFLSKKYSRPFQLHIYEDFFDKTFVNAHKHPTLYTWSLEYLLNRVRSVRTKTEFQRQAVVAENPEIETATELLPTYYNLSIWRDFKPTFDLHERYPRFKFLILHVSSMQKSSHTMEVLTGAAKVLRQYPSIGLIIVGNGPLRHQLERTVIALGLQRQVEFEAMPAEIISHMKTANLYIHMSEDGREDELLLQAAVSRLPLIANASGLAVKLFNDGESACLCNIDDSACIGDKINMYLNENQNRARFALNASGIVFERIEQDYAGYLDAYCESIERSMIQAS